MAAAGATDDAWTVVSRSLSRSLAGSGMDIVAPLALSWYNDAMVQLKRPELQLMPPHPHRHGEQAGEDGTEGVACNHETSGSEAQGGEPFSGQAPVVHDCLAVIVGNSRAMWDHFVAALKSDDAQGLQLRSSAHPLNMFVSAVVTKSAEAATRQAEEQGVAGDVAWTVYWSHDTRPGKLVAIQRMAAVAGVAYLDDQDSHLCIHPEFGPWFSLRAVILFNVKPPTQRPQAVPCPLDDAARARVQHAMAAALRGPQEAAASSSHCSTMSVRGEDKEGIDAKALQQHVVGAWQLWVASRDAISPHHPHRYAQQQIEYHYTTSRAVLDKIIAAS